VGDASRTGGKSVNGIGDVPSYPPGCLLGVDVGAVRNGLARTDPFRLFPTPVGTFSPKEALQEIEHQVKHEGPVAAVIVGYPLSLEGEKTHGTQHVENFIRQLKKRLPGLPVLTMDERFSTKIARRLLVESGVPKKKRAQKGRVDVAAASWILQEFLEANPEWSTAVS
jgi:RNAse H-fold protein YqgF